MSTIQAKTMRDMIAMFPDLMTRVAPRTEVIERAQRVSDAGIGGVCLVGMGGSAIGGEICRAVLAPSARVPILTVKDYMLPECVGADWVVVAVSYSGNTEETVSAYEQAQSRGCRSFVVTTGGRLGDMADAATLVRIPAGLQPRAALPLMMSVLYPLLLELLGLEPFDAAATADLVKSAFEEIVGSGRSPRMVAELLTDKIPLFVGWRHLSPVAYRAKCQVNENAKAPALFAELPELDHNEIEACGLYNDRRVVPVVLRSPMEDGRAKKRAEATLRVIEDAGTVPIEIWGAGPSPVVEALAVTFFCDYVSLELAEMRNVDPVTVHRISQLKKLMAD
ncbi:MAG: bifunctional phosphoglucose/phosphomannose isomerase [Candidatus Thorarchaeota archaeon]